MIVLIFLLALGIRLISLASIPHSFHMDEVANTYLGRFIITNGADIYGNSWPIFFVDKFGDFPPVIPMYLSGLASYIFGLNEFSSRFPSAIIGSLIVFPLYFLVEKLLNRKVALFSAVLIAITPWHVSLSRSSSEGIIGLTVCLWGLANLVGGIKEKKSRPIYIGGALLLLTYLLYPVFRLLVPLLIVPLAVIYRNKTVLFVLIAAVVCTTLISQTTWGKGRFMQTSLFYNETDHSVIVNDLTAQITDDKTSLVVSRMFHNKIVGYSQRLVEQYLSYFSPAYLFVEGGPPQRYDTPHVGLLFYASLIVFVVMLFGKKFSQIEFTSKVYLLWLILVAVIPSALTVDDWPNVHRSLFLMIPLTIFFAHGLWSIWQRGFLGNARTGRFLAFAICAVLLFEVISGGHQYFAHAGSKETFRRTDGNKELALYLKEVVGQYDQILVTSKDWMPLYYLFYTQNFDGELIGKFEQNFWVSQLGTISFIEKDCVKSFPIVDYTKTLLVEYGDCEVLPTFEEIDRITRRDGTTAFKMVVAKSGQ